MPRENMKSESVLASLHRLSRDGRSWVAAEAALAQSEVASDAKRLVELLALFTFVLSCLFAALILLSVFAVALLAPHVGGMANAAGLLSLALIVITMLSGWRIWHLCSIQSGLLSTLKRWWSFAAIGPGGTHDTK